MPEQFEMPAGFSGNLPIFPLAGMVFFPKTLLPLRIYEPRYRKMLADSLLGERLIGILYSSVGPSAAVSVHRVGTIGKIALVERLPTGESNVVLSGAERFYLSESPNLGDYLTAKVSVYPEALPNPDDPVMYAQLRRLVAMVAESGMLELGDFIIPQAGGALRFQYHSLINAFCSIANAPLDTKQKWLELRSVNERYRSIIPVIAGVLEGAKLVDRISHLAPGKDKILLN